jgi:glycosyltransferase involved in cell wall biosynthesis
MKIILIAPGYKTLPPVGWGAVESIVWDYYENLIKKGIETSIVNTPNVNQIITECNQQIELAGSNTSAVYIMYDDYIVVAPYIKCPRIYYMSHYAYITQPQFRKKQPQYFTNIFSNVVKYQNNIVINAISDEIAQIYENHGVDKRHINVIHNGAREDLFQYSTTPTKPERSVYVAKIEARKRQYIYQNITSIDFVGNYHDTPFNKMSPQYLGEWDKPTLYNSLTEYGNLVLLSDGEADPLVVKEALIAGLGVVVSECASANLDRNRAFITVIPNSRLDDIVYVEEMIRKNREYCATHREEIREYALAKFSWNKIVDKFIKIVYTK